MSFKPHGITLLGEIILKILEIGNEIQLLYDLLTIDVISSILAGWIEKLTRLH